MATMNDIAKKAGVSQATVSRVLRGNPVSQELVAKVRAAAEEVGYYKKWAKTIAPKHRKRTGFVGLLFLGVRSEQTRLPHMVDLLLAFEKALRTYDFQLAVSVAPHAELPSLVTPNRLDGVLVVGHPAKKIQKSLARLNCVLLLGAARHDATDPWADWVCPNYPNIGSLAANHLIKKGHKRLSYLNLQPGHPGLQEVQWGFQNTCQKQHALFVPIPLPPAKNDAIWNGPAHLDEIRQFMHAFAKMAPNQRPTGLLVSEYTALAPIYDLAAAHAIRIGKDLELVSRVHEANTLTSLSPQPASVATPETLIAELAVQRLVHRMQSPQSPAGLRLLVPPQLICPQ